MVGIGTPELFVFGVFWIVVTLTVAYFVIRFAVRDGVVDANRRLAADDAAVNLRRVLAQRGVDPATEDQR
jgi:hypothetical protein